MPSVFIVGYCLMFIQLIPTIFFSLHQEVSSSCIFSLASITMANHQEYSFTQFPSIQMVRSFYVKQFCVFGVHVYNV